MIHFAGWLQGMGVGGKRKKKQPTTAATEWFWSSELSQRDLDCLLSCTSKPILVHFMVLKRREIRNLNSMIWLPNIPAIVSIYFLYISVPIFFKKKKEFQKPCVTLVESQNGSWSLIRTWLGIHIIWGQPDSHLAKQHLSCTRGEGLIATPDQLPAYVTSSKLGGRPQWSVVL